MKLRKTLLFLLVPFLTACGLIRSFSNQSISITLSAVHTPTVQPSPTITPSPTPTPTPLPEIRLEMGEEALRTGDWEIAIEEFTSVFSTNVDEDTKFAARLGKARTAFLDGRSNETIDEIEALLAESTSTNLLPDAYFLLAQAYEDRDRFADAALAYAKYLDLRPGLIDAYVYELIGDALFAEGDFTGAAQAFNASIQAPGLLDRTFLEMKMARSLALSGDIVNALTMYDDIYIRNEDSATRALINLRKGQIYLEKGQTDDAYSVFLDSVENYPTAYEAYSALVALVDAGIPVDELSRGMVDFFAGQYGPALAAFDRYLQRSPPDPATAYYYIGLINQYADRYQDALSWWDKIIQNYPDHPYWDDAWEQKGFTQWYYMEDYPEAISTLTAFVNENPEHVRATEFLDDAARAAERSGDLILAEELWKRLAIEYPDDQRAAEALFLSGICFYRLEQYQEANRAFQGALGISQKLEQRARAYLWIGKTFEAMGDLESTRKAWQEGAEVDPTGYYSERSKDLLTGKGFFSPPEVYDLAVDTKAEENQAEKWLRDVFVIPETENLEGLGALAEEPSLKRGTELWKLGLQLEARQEFETLRQAVSDDPILTYQLANYLEEIGLYRSATFAARQVLDLAGMDDASSLVAPKLFNRLRFGTYYSDMIIPVAIENNIHPLFLFSLIRQESLFESFVQSSAAARGLMQIIPATGLEVSEKLGWPANYDDSDLNRPLVSITLGTAYLAEQLDRFDGDFYAALAAYNGGPGNSMQWKEIAPDDPDLFLEVIRFSETQDYIRRIYETFAIYRRLYDRSP